MLNGAKPFVVAHDAQSEHFSTSGTLLNLRSSLAGMNFLVLGNKSISLTCLFSSIFPLECKRKIQSKQPSHVYDWLQDMDILDL